MCDRNEVEGRNGNLKRRYSLARFMCKLDGTAKSEAAWCIIDMNTRHRIKLQRDCQRNLAKEQACALAQQAA